MSTPPLTRRQKDILDFFREYQERNGLWPTLEEIAQHLGVNKVTVFGHVAELEKKGVIKKRAKRASRSLAIVGKKAAAPARTHGVRILGTIAAGRPISTIETEEELELDHMLGRGRDLYALRVKGNSMIEDSIRDGDVVVVERRTNPHNGETVVAVLEGEEATLKRYYDEGDVVRLQPANAELNPVRVKKDALEIRGVLVAVVRTF
ncbi:MAG: repressor LexA [Planctomycetes bacterium]|nr:repressor LexA [Planctomycetota bacterium]